MIVATAGHVDHGKTTLIQALTGIDTTHLPEERRRGMTIDLGFAGLPLPDAGHIGFVDVPGHERFVRNMLAGITGVDLALLVVAADDGIMPQTREHLEILDLLQVRRGVVALTKTDRVNAARVAEVRGQVDALLAPTQLAGAPVFAVSAPTGAGVEALRRHLIDCAATAVRPHPGAHFRLPVDRCFAVEGAGLVVTGSIAAGRVSLDDRLRLLPIDKPLRVRALHTHRHAVGSLGAGERCALNLLAPDLDRSQVRRGQWIVAPALALTTGHIDVRLLPARGGALKDGMRVQFCHGAASLPARLVLLTRTGTPVYAQLVLAEPAHALARDAFILRHGDGTRTVAGGIVVDPFPPQRGRRRPERLALLAALDQAEARDALARALPLAQEGIDLARFAQAWNLPAGAVDGLLPPAALARSGAFAFDAAQWQQKRAAALAAVARFHAEQPDSYGPTAPALLRDATLGAARAFRGAVLESLIHERQLLRDGAQLRLPSHSIDLTLSEKVIWRRIAPLLGPGRRPMTLHDIARRERAELRPLKRVLDRATRAGLVVCVAPGRYLHRSAVQEFALLAETLATTADGGRFSTAAFRDRSNLGRGISIELLEYFDRIGYTCRVGDLRRLQRPATAVFESRIGGSHG